MDNFKNFAKVTVSTGYDAVATSIVLSSGHAARLPTAPFNVTWWNDTDYPDPSDDPSVEIVRVTAIASDTLTVTRGQESTSISPKNIASKTYRMIAGLTAKTFNTDLGAAVVQAGSGRLTLATGEPVVDSHDVTGATSIYFAPYKGNVISLYNGSIWVPYSFSEVSLALGTLTADKNYDVFLYNNAGTLTLELSAAWATNATRTDALSFQNGIYVKSGAPTRRYLGTFRTTSTTTTEDSQTRRLLWNVDNQVVRRGYKQISGSHNYSGGWRLYNGDATAKVEVLVGVTSVGNIGFSGQIAAVGGAAYIAVGINSAAGPSGDFAFANSDTAQVGGVFGLGWALDLGFSEINLLENSGAGSSFFAGGSLSVTLFT